jgi:streptogramin lyase
MSDNLFALIVTLAVLATTLVWVPSLHLCHKWWCRISRAKTPWLGLALLLPLISMLTGCALTDTATTHNPVPGPAVSGVAFGGQQAIVGAKVYLLAANPAGYGSASLSLLTTASTGNAVDSVGAYVTTAASTGGFNLAPAGNADYDCTQGYALGVNTATATPTNLIGNEQVYLYIKGGNSGSGTNNNVGLLAALGPCNNIYSNTITVNELTTIAAAYAMAGYATDATHLASSGTSLALTGLSNAGLNSANLVSLATGLPVANSSSILRPVANIYTLGDILAACVNGKSGNTNCSTLFTYTQSAGTTGTAPTDTATAAINLAHNPWPSAAGMTALYGLIPATGAPFSGGLSSQPTDFTLGLTYTGGGISKPFFLAIDGSGNAWTSNSGNNSVSKISSTGTPISPSAGYTAGAINKPSGIAIDSSGNVWISNSGSNSATALTSSGNLFATSTGVGLNNPSGNAVDGSGHVWFANAGANSVTVLTSTGGLYATSTAGGVNQPQAVAIDGSGYAWTANYSNNTVSRLTSTGGGVSPTAGYTAGGLSSPLNIAIDSSGRAWITNSGNNSVTALNSSGTVYATSTGGGLNYPAKIAIDGSGNAWITNYLGFSVSKLSSTGTPLSPSTGYSAAGPTSPNGIALDGSGDVWISNSADASLTEIIGAATPVVTPLSASLTAPYSAPASKP